MPRLARANTAVASSLRGLRDQRPAGLLACGTSSSSVAAGEVASCSMIAQLSVAGLSLFGLANSTDAQLTQTQVREAATQQTDTSWVGSKRSLASLSHLSCSAADDGLLQARLAGSQLLGLLLAVQLHQAHEQRFVRSPGALLLHLLLLPCWRSSLLEQVLAHAQACAEL